MRRLRAESSFRRRRSRRHTAGRLRPTAQQSPPQWFRGPRQPPSRLRGRSRRQARFQRPSRLSIGHRRLRPRRRSHRRLRPRRRRHHHHRRLRLRLRRRLLRRPRKPARSPATAMATRTTATPVLPARARRASRRPQRCRRAGASRARSRAGGPGCAGDPGRRRASGGCPPSSEPARARLPGRPACPSHTHEHGFRRQPFGRDRRDDQPPPQAPAGLIPAAQTPPATTSATIETRPSARPIFARRMAVGPGPGHKCRKRRTEFANKIDPIVATPQAATSVSVRGPQ